MIAGPVIGVVSTLAAGGFGLALARGMRRAADRMQEPGEWPTEMMEEFPGDHAPHYYARQDGELFELIRPEGGRGRGRVSSRGSGRRPRRRRSPRSGC